LVSSPVVKMWSRPDPEGGSERRFAVRSARLLPIGLFAAVLLLVGLAVVGPGLQDTSAQEQRVENLVAGICTPVTSTHPDGTSAATVGQGVSPADALVSLWFFIAAEARWSGYSPAVPPELSDLQTVDRLDVVFVCVSADAVITMPSI
jgi:hypothetical protein